MEKRFLKWLIILSIVIIFCILGLIYILKSNGSEFGKNSNIQDEIPDEEPEMQTFLTVSDYNDYFIIKNILEDYSLYMQYINGDYYIYDNQENNNTLNQVNEIQRSGLDSVKDMLDEKYINEMNISDKQLIEKSQQYKNDNQYQDARNSKYLIRINSLYCAELSYTKRIFLIETEINDKKENMLIKIDNDKNLFSIFLSDYIENNNINKDLKKESFNIIDGDLQENENNRFVYHTISNEEISQEYLNMYKFDMLYNGEQLYNKLNEQYGKARFKNYNDFNQYLQDMKETVESSALAKYNVQYEEEKTTSTYKILDNYENYYVFYVSDDNICDYRVELDDYTIETDEFKNSYNSASDEEKVKTDVQKFIKMINSADYSNAANLLDNTFKQNNFVNISEFRQYVNQHFKNHQINSTKEFEKSGSYYICTIELEKDLEKSEETFIVQLKEGTQFILSFTKK